MHVTPRTIVGICILLGGLAVGAWIGIRAWHDRPPATSDRSSFVTFTEEIMAAPITVVVPAERGRIAADMVFDTFRDVDRRMSEWKPTSPLSAVNRSAGRDAVRVPDDLRAVVRRAVEIGDLTDGAFDVTWAALWGLWDFTSPEPRVPSAAEITQRVDRVNYARVRIDDEQGTIFLPDAGMVLGLGGIAKGHALDQSAAALRNAGITDFLISAGGQVLVGGKHGDRSWRLGIRDPRGPATDFFAFLELSDTCVSTSGDYERFFIKDGERYHHILDPRTGRPCRGLRAVTVVCTDATLADALSTAFMVMGREASTTMLDRLDGVEAVLVDDAGGFVVTDGLADRLEVLRNPRS